MAGAGVGGTSRNSSEPWFSNHAASRVLHITHFAYPILILLDFLVVFTLHSVLTAADESVSSSVPRKTGPGGKPLPPTTRRSRKQAVAAQGKDFSRSQKLTFDWLLVGVIVTFVGNAINIIVHALVKRPWWCGEAAVVRSDSHA